MPKNTQLATTDNPADMFTVDQVELIKRNICPHATDDELQLFLGQCRRTRLDPFARQIYSIERAVWNKETRTLEPRRSIQVSIDGFRLIAERTGKYRGQTAQQWCAADGVWQDYWTKLEAPAGARVGVYREGSTDPIWGFARFASYVSVDRDNKPLAMWRKMPEVMIAKCLPYRAEITTDMGTLKIGDIVTKRLPVKVRSIDFETGEECWAPVVNYWRNGSTDEWVKLWVPNNTRGNRCLRMTPDHPVRIRDGFLEAGKLTKGGHIAVSSPTLSPEQTQVLLGGLLGDGTLGGRKTPSSCPHYAEAHSVKQIEYLRWKAAALSNLRPKFSVDAVVVKGTSHQVARLRTAAVPALYSLREQFYTASQKVVSQSTLEDLSDLGVAVWLMDDGSVRGDYRAPSRPAIMLYTCAFSKEEHKAIVGFFLRKYGVTPTIRREHNNPYLAFGVDDAAILLERLAAFIRFDSGRNAKQWVAGPIPQGLERGVAYVPVLRVEPYKGDELEGRFDIEVEGTHNFLYNNVVVSNCAEALALRRAFPQELSGLQTDDEMEQETVLSITREEQMEADNAASNAKLIEAGGTVTVIEPKKARAARKPKEEPKTAWQDVVCHVGQANGPMLGKKVYEMPRKVLNYLQDKWIPSLTSRTEKDSILIDAIREYFHANPIEPEPEPPKAEKEAPEPATAPLVASGEVDTSIAADSSAQDVIDRSEEESKTDWRSAVLNIPGGTYAQGLTLGELAMHPPQFKGKDVTPPECFRGLNLNGVPKLEARGADQDKALIAAIVAASEHVFWLHGMSEEELRAEIDKRFGSVSLITRRKVLSEVAKLANLAPDSKELLRYVIDEWENVERLVEEEAV